MLCYHYRIISEENCINKLKTNKWYIDDKYTFEDLMDSDYPEIHDETMKCKSIYEHVKKNTIVSNSHLGLLTRCRNEPNVKEFFNIKENIDLSKFSYDEIKNFYFFPSKRWDLEFNNNIIIRLPKNNINNALDLAFEFMHNQNLEDIKIIDLRVKNQIILND